MLRLLRINSIRFSSGPQRRQNFFELNPIFPDNGQKDFDIYNKDYNHVYTNVLTDKDMDRELKIKDKLVK